MCLKEQKSDIIFLQETYSTAEVEDIWRTQWQGKLFFSHGTCHSCVVMVLVRGDLDFNLISIRTDDEGRYIALEAEVQGANFLFVNVMVLKTFRNSARFIENLNSTIDDVIRDNEPQLVVGGDFIVTLESDLDCSGGNPSQKASVKSIQDLCLDFDLVDIWRIRNPTTRRYTWRQRNPFIQRRLDFWLLNKWCLSRRHLRNQYYSVNKF